jgi:hypothetical protein
MWYYLPDLELAQQHVERVDRARDHQLAAACVWSPAEAK